MLPPSSQEKTLVQAVAETTLPLWIVSDTSGARAEDPPQTPEGATARVTSREAIEGMVRFEHRQYSEVA